MEAMWLHSDGQQAEFKLSLDLFLSNGGSRSGASKRRAIASNSTKCDEPLNCTVSSLKHSASFAFSNDGMQINADEVEKYNKLARMKINCWRVSFLRVGIETIVSLVAVEVGSVVEAEKRGVMRSSLLAVASLFVCCLFFKFLEIKTSWRLLEISQTSEHEKAFK